MSLDLPSPRANVANLRAKATTDDERWICDEFVRLFDAIDVRDAFNAELLAALKPFSDIDGEGDEDFHDETPVQLKFGRTTAYRPVTLGDLRAAREAVAKIEDRE